MAMQGMAPSQEQEHCALQGRSGSKLLSRDAYAAWRAAPRCRALGLDLYRDAARPPCEAIFGDITQDAFLPPGAAAGSSSNEASSNSSEAGGIRRLAGAVTVASCTAVLHCLGREDVDRLLSKVGSSSSCCCSGGWDGHGHGWPVPVNCMSASAGLACAQHLQAVRRNPSASGHVLLVAHEQTQSPRMLCLQTALLLRPGGLLLGSTLGAPSPREWEAAYQAGNKRW